MKKILKITFVGLIIFCGFSSSKLVIAAIPDIERSALIALYDSTDGDNWTNNSGWKNPPLDADGFAMPGEETNWYGVTVAGEHVIQLWLGDNSLSGPIPPDLGDLSNLQGLYLFTNSLTGPIPPELGDLSNLIHLVLFNNSLSGSIPPALGSVCPEMGYFSSVPA